MTETYNQNSFTRSEELKRLSIKTRNRVRAILTAEKKDAFRFFNHLREEKSASELLQIERILRQSHLSSDLTIPSLFPRDPQTTESFLRLSNLGLAKQVLMLESLVKENFAQLSDMSDEIRRINEFIVAQKYEDASQLIGAHLAKHGFSHFIMRKAALIKSIGDENLVISDVKQLLSDAGMERRNILVTSLIHCYADEQDFLSLKKSIMSFPKRGDSNKFTRDISRIAFHPLASDKEDLCSLIQSTLQSSLYDAILIAKVNCDLLVKYSVQHPQLKSIFAVIDDGGTSVDEIAALFPSDDMESEAIFYKQSSAWLENSSVVMYRAMQDHFYDYPESDYFEIDAGVLDRVKSWVNPIPLNDLVNAKQLTSHKYLKLRAIEQAGTVTRSSMFNYLLYLEEGYANIEEPQLLELMGKTRDLSKTIDPQHLSNLAKVCTSQISQLALYLLIAKKSKNELHDHRLRRILQTLVKQEPGGKLVNLLDKLDTLSRAVAIYAYEVCTEDFIAKLFHIISTSSEITETRASLHQWMGVTMNEQAYLDRARTLLIDHQLNKIRNEIDDYRIYVDAGRFSEWINDEIMRDLNGALTSIAHKNALLGDQDAQLVSIIERCYESFCSNDIFGIASYLGRRIRHGTFKGHLYSTVISIERQEKYKALLREPAVAAKWGRWKLVYESKIDAIIKDQLHLESSSKKEGLLKPKSATVDKQETIAICAKYIARDFSESKSTAGATGIITEYCWRLAEYDLKSVNTFLKNQKASLTNQELLMDLRNYAHRTDAAMSFCRELTRSIDEHLMAMYSWFKRPANVSPRASVSLLYKAVVAEVKETFPDFETGTDYEASEDIELMGGAYHVLYDSLYVIVFNAAKHGDREKNIQRAFNIVGTASKPSKLLTIKFTSAIKDGDSEIEVGCRLAIDPDDDISGAQVSENRSGIRKLHHLAQIDKNFLINSIKCADRQVTIELSYSLEN